MDRSKQTVEDDPRQRGPGLMSTSAVSDRIDFGELFEKAPVAMLIFNRDRRLCHLNEAAVAMANRVKEDAIGLRGGELLRCVHAFSDPRGCGYSKACDTCIVRKTVLDTFQTGVDHRSVEASFRRGVNDAIDETWVHMSTSRINLPEGERVLICLEDISDRKRAEKALRLSERNFRLVTETTEDVFWMSTCGIGKMLYVSPAYETLWGRSREDLYRSPRSFMEAIHPEDRDRYLNVLSAFHAKGKPYDCEYRILKKDGSVRWIREKGYPVAHSLDAAALMSGICSDITDLKQTEAALTKKNTELLLNCQLAHLFLTSPSEEVFVEILELLRGAFNCRCGYFGYIDEAGDLVCPSMTRMVWDQCRIPQKNIVFPKDGWAGLWGRSLQEKVSLRRNSDLRTPEGHIPLRNAMVVPLVVQDRLVGQFALANTPSAFTQDDEERLNAIADFLAPILQIYLEKEKVKKQLVSEAGKLRERNIALKVLLETHGQEKKQQVEKITRNFEKLVLPYYDKIMQCHDRDTRRTLLEIVEANTHVCLSAEKASHSPSFRDLTPMEVQVADLIKLGKTSKEIAELLHISPRSVYFHRNNLRRKLNIHKTKSNLKAFLNSHAGIV
jgi:PAS domain S-box-containing protein